MLAIAPKRLFVLALAGAIILSEAIAAAIAWAFVGEVPGWLWLAALVAPMVVASGELALLLGVIARLHAQSAERALAMDGQHRSEADLRAILDNMTDIFYRADSHGHMTMISRSVEQILGYRPAQVVGKPARDFYCDPVERAALLAAMDAGNGSVTDYEIRMRHSQGHPVWVATSSHFLRDEGGAVVGVEGIVRLIEERKRSEKNLEDSQSLIQALINASPDATMLFRRDGTILAVNEVFASRFDRKVENVCGASLWDMFPTELAQARRQAVEEVMQSGHAVRTHDCRDGRHFDNSIYPVADSDGIFDKVAVFSRDITEEVTVQARIKSYIEDMERSNGELEQFAYVASHDLREPLRMISSYLSLLERRYGQLLEGDGLEFLAYARDGAKRMDRLVLDLLEFSRIQRRGDPIVAIQARETVNLALQHLSVTVSEMDAHVEVEVTEDIQVMGDFGQIARLFQNLIGNALKYRDAERKPHIRVEARRNGNLWEFAVADNGIGIEEQYFDRIFGIFQRLHTRDAYDGTGIGLAICRKIVERHGGTIWLESEPGRGSKFFFTLPVAGYTESQ